MKITDNNILEGLLIADVLFDVRLIKNNLREICEQCVYLIYGDKL